MNQKHSPPFNLSQLFFRKEDGTHHYNASTMSFTDLFRMLYERTRRKNYVQGIRNCVTGVTVNLIAFAVIQLKNCAIELTPITE